MKSTKMSDFRRDVPGRLRLRAAALFLFAAGLLATGCSKEQELEPEEGNGSGKVAVSFEVEGLSEMTTKAALTANTTVRVIAYSSNASNPATANYVADQAYYWNGSKLVPCTVDANGNKTADAADAAMKLLPGNYDFYAVSPALPLATDKRTLSTAVNNYVDYATSKKTQQIPVQVNPYALTLNELQRKCAQVKFIVKKDDSYVNPTTMSINSVKVTGLAAAVSGVTVGADIAPASSGTQVLTLASGDFSNSGMTYTTKNNYLLLPLGGATLTFSFTMTMDGTSKTYSGELTGLTLEKSKTYTITAQISSESDITFSVDAWTQNTGNNPNLTGRDYPYVVDGKIIVVKGQFGSATDCPLHGSWTTTPDHGERVEYENYSGINTASGTFEVAKTPFSGKNIAADKTICETYSEESGAVGTWRLPTIRELNIIKRLFTSLTATNIRGSSSPTFMSVTAYNSTSNYWCVNLANSSVSYMASTTSVSLICVRDVGGV